MSHDDCNNNESLLAELTLNEDVRLALKNFLSSLQTEELSGIEGITTIAIFQNEKISFLRFPNEIQEPIIFSISQVTATSTTYEPGHEGGVCCAYKVTRNSDGSTTKVKYATEPQGQYDPPYPPYKYYYSVGRLPLPDGRCCIFVEDVMDNGGGGIQRINKRPWKIE